MNASIKTLAVIVLSLAAAAATTLSGTYAQTSSADLGRDTLVAACEKNAGAFNHDEKAACIKVALEGQDAPVAVKNDWVHPVVAQVQACKKNAGAFNSDEKAGCITAAIEQYTAYCAVAAGPAMSVERDACIRVVVESALDGVMSAL